MASGIAGGYRFTLSGTVDAWAVTAVPVAYGSSGVKSFYSDQTMIVRVSDGPSHATAASPEFK